MQSPQQLQHDLDPDWQEAVEWAFTGSSHFPWQFQPQKSRTAEPEPWNSQFTHEFFRDGSVVSPFWDIVEPLVIALDPLSLIRVKANLTIATETRRNHEWHKDSDDSRLRAAIYYANTNNGSTEFITGEMIDSSRGQLITFPADCEHRAWTHTDVQARAVVSFLYLAKN
jgi:hypothetical protein